MEIEVSKTLTIACDELAGFSLLANKSVVPVKRESLTRRFELLALFD